MTRATIVLGVTLLSATMITCSLDTPSFLCEATVLLGDDLSVHYASPTAAYAWTTAWGGERPGRSILYRLPFDGGPVSAIRVRGFPPNQLAFLEDEAGYLNVVVHHPNDGVTLLRLAPSSFSDGRAPASRSDYRPIAHGLGPGLTTRFIGRYVLVGGQSWRPDEPGPRTIVVTLRDGDATFLLTLAHDAQRIEAIGANAIVVGTDGTGLSMSAIRLGARPTVAGVLTQPDALQSENRSHGFFYRSDTEDTGLFGLPIVTGKMAETNGTSEESAGTLDGADTASADDRCRVSCIDWYGDARPIFVADRIFALIRYEIIEGRLAGGRIEELRRINFTPRQSGLDDRQCRRDSVL